MFEEEDPAHGSVTAWVRDEESLQPSVVIPPWEGHGPPVIPMKLTMVEYAQLTGQEQLEWWSAGGELKV